MEVEPDEDDLAIRTPALELVGADAISSDAWAEGRALALADAVELAKSSETALVAAL